MMFKLLLESPHLIVDLIIPTSTGHTVRVDMIDIRFEDLIQKRGLKFKDYYHWLAPLDWAPYNGKQFLTHDHGVITDIEAQSLVAKGHTVLPPNWWEFTFGLFNDTVVKASAATRPGEPSQAELDHSGDFADRLDLALAG